MQKTRTRKMRVSLNCVIATPSWTQPTIMVRQWTGSEFHEATLVVEDPWQLSYLRRELDKIEAGWRARIERCK